jgi:hypothetical protein
MMRQILQLEIIIRDEAMFYGKCGNDMIFFFRNSLTRIETNELYESKSKLTKNFPAKKKSRSFEYNDRNEKAMQVSKKQETTRVISISTYDVPDTAIRDYANVAMMIFFFKLSY